MCRTRTSASCVVGQEAVIKVESFPFTRYGSLNAHVMRIAKDAIPSPDASAIEGDPTRVSKASGFAGARADPESRVRGRASSPSPRPSWSTGSSVR